MKKIGKLIGLIGIWICLCGFYPSPITTPPTTSVNAVIYGFNPTNTAIIPVRMNADGSFNVVIEGSPVPTPTPTPTWTPVGTLPPTPTPMPPLGVVNPAPSGTPTALLVDCPGCSGGSGSSATPNATVVSGKDLQLTQVAQQATANAIATVNYPAPLYWTPTNTPVLTPTATVNPTQIPLMIATMQAQQNAIQTQLAILATVGSVAQFTAVPNATIQQVVFPGTQTSTATPNATQNALMIATVQGQLNAVQTQLAGLATIEAGVIVVVQQGTQTPTATPQIQFTAIPPPTPDQTKVSGKDIQLTQVAQQLTANAIATSNYPAPLYWTPTNTPVLTPTSTPNPTQVPAMVATVSTNLLALQTQVALQATIVSGQGTPIGPSSQATAVAAQATAVAAMSTAIAGQGTPIAPSAQATAVAAMATEFASVNSTPTATPNGTQVPAMIATQQVQFNAIQTQLAALATIASGVLITAPQGTQTPTATPYAPHTDANNNQINAFQNSLGEVNISGSYNQTEVNFSNGFSALTNLIVCSESGNGTTQINKGELQLATGATAGQATCYTNITLEYRAGHEWYARFTGAFSAGQTNTYQRLGVYDSTDGIWIGNESGASAVTFGITWVQAGVTTFIPQSSWNGDAVTGQTGSKYVSQGSPVSMNQGYLQPYRIHGSWFGAAPVYVDVLSPDGAWVNLHTFRFPNKQVAPYTSTTNWSIEADVKKTSGSTPVTLSSACWALGTGDPTMFLSDNQYDYSGGQNVKAYLGGRQLSGVYINENIAGPATPVASTMSSLSVGLNPASSNGVSVTDWTFPTPGGLVVPVNTSPTPNLNVNANILAIPAHAVTDVAVETAVAGLNAKAVTLNTGAVAFATTPGVAEYAVETAVSGTNSKCVTMNTGAVAFSATPGVAEYAVETAVAGFNSKSVTMNTGAVAFASTPIVSALMVDGAGNTISSTGHSLWMIIQGQSGALTLTFGGTAQPMSITGGTVTLGGTLPYYSGPITLSHGGVSQPVTGTIGSSAGSTINIGNTGGVSLGGGTITYYTHTFTAVSTPVAAIAAVSSTYFNLAAFLYNPTSTAEAVTIIHSGTTFTVNVPATNMITQILRGSTANSPVSLAYSGGATLLANIVNITSTQPYLGPLP